MAVGGVVGGITGGAIYALTNQGASFNRTEFFVSVGAGAVAGGLVGSGIGILNMVAAGSLEGGYATTVLATRLISAGTSAGSSEVVYMVNNQSQFQSSTFTVDASISGGVGYITGDPKMGPIKKAGVEIAGAEMTDFSSTDNPNFMGAASTAGGAILASGSDYGLDITYKKMFYPGEAYLNCGYASRLFPNSDCVRTANYMRQMKATGDTFYGMVSGFITGGANTWAQNMAPY